MLHIFRLVPSEVCLDFISCLLDINYSCWLTNADHVKREGHGRTLRTGLFVENETKADGDFHPVDKLIGRQPAPKLIPDRIRGQGYELSNHLRRLLVDLGETSSFTQLS